jgi:hypothetical protein
LRFLPLYPFPTLPGDLSLLSIAILLGVSLALIFAGRIVIKGIAFILVGLGAALVGSSLGSLFMGTTGALLGGVLGFVAGGVLGVILLPLSIAFALGYAGYTLGGNSLSLGALSIVVAVVLFVIALVLSGKILALVSTVLGCLILFNLAILEGLDPLAATVAVFIMGAMGFIVQVTE